MKSSQRDLLIFIVAVLGSICLQVAFYEFGIREENIYLIFVLAVLIIIIETKKIVYGIIAALLMVMSFNFFITEPRYSFVVADSNYIVSFIIFILVVLIANSIVIQLHKQIFIANENEERIESLYDMTSQYLNYKNLAVIYDKTSNSLNYMFEQNVTIIDSNKEIHGKKFDTTKYEETINKVMRSNRVYTTNNISFFPIKSTVKDYGVIIVNKKLTEDEKDFILNVTESMTLVLDKDFISTEQQRSKIQFEKEKFRNSLLRALSHDIKTPLTMIQSGSEFIVDSYDVLDESSKKDIVKDIYKESVYLYDFVNNLLDMTMMSDDKKIINYNLEMLDDIYFEVSETINKRLADKSLNIEEVDDVVMVNCDGKLLSHVFINLIDNAINHTKPNTIINLKHWIKDDKIYFEVSDNGGGIKEDILTSIFDDFYSMTSKGDRKRSHGLGLSICKAIIEAHKGEIRAYNNDNGGASFEFYIPLKQQGGEING